MKKYQTKNKFLFVTLLLVILPIISLEQRAFAEDGLANVPSQTNDQTDEDIKTYWTPERMRDAQPIQMRALPPPPFKMPPPPSGISAPSSGISGGPPIVSPDQQNTNQ